jgi:ELWxxDGT repeat protein
MRNRALDVGALTIGAAFVAWTSTAALAVEVARIVDIDSGPAGSGAGWLTVYEDRLYFTANDLTHGNNVELWRYDGLEVSRAAEIRPGPEGSTPSDLAVHDGTLFFGARGDDGPPRLWRFDGETASPAPGSASGAQNPGELTSFGGALWFRAFRSGFGVELWRHDGATQTIFDLYPGSGSSYPQHIIEHDGAVDVSDPVRVLLRLFAGAPPLACAAAANVNDDEAVDISDPTALLAHLFLGGSPPPAP